MPDTAQRPFRPEDGSLDAFAVALGELLIRQKQVDDKELIARAGSRRKMGHA